MQTRRRVSLIGTVILAVGLSAIVLSSRTNDHVVADADVIEVALMGKQTRTATAPGTRVQLKAIRDGQKRSLSVIVEALALEAGRGTATRAREGGRGFGLALDDLTPSISRQLRVPAGVDGAVVTEVADDGAAGRAGLQPGDIIREVNRRAVHTAAEASRALQRIQTGQPVFVLLWREGNNLFVQMQKD